ncbi:hypothetical protein INH39_16360 [Massilia violaceinigra]|uniref:Uncharacterized protein n=1 Tax=Massilia violaceinigra TaxID=2045208 RepID=A0ABY4AF88_9BURK|nr:hypothetical protein [Massilia violaceinigra]UOD33067.1 hypothetical protein INH39_16360 [Massilia violaceinigra]
MALHERAIAEQAEMLLVDVVRAWLAQLALGTQRVHVVVISRFSGAKMAPEANNFRKVYLHLHFETMYGYTPEKLPYEPGPVDFRTCQ